MNKTSERQSNIELLRIILMMMVITVHFNIPSGHAIELASSHSLNQNILYLLESFSICAVNTFIVITGYFSCASNKSRLSKALLLFIQACIYNLAIYLIMIIIGKSAFSFGQLIIHSLPNSWFTSIYIALYLLSPYLNKLINTLSEKAFKQLLIICFILFSIQPFMLSIMNDYLGWNIIGLSTVSIDGAINGYTLINFIFMYLIGAYIRIYGINFKIHPQILFIGFSIIIYFGFKLMYGYSEMFYDYCNPFIILQTIALFLSFQKLHIPVLRPINQLSKQAFSVYLLHGQFYILFDIEKIVIGATLKMILTIPLICITLYIIPWIIACIYDFIIHPIRLFLSNNDYIIEP